jgi:hypothetical protein
MPLPKKVAAVGHRIVHGLDIAKAVLLDDSVVRKIEKARGGGVRGRSVSQQAARSSAPCARPSHPRQWSGAARPPEETVRRSR